MSKDNKQKKPIPKKFRLSIYRYRFNRDHPEEAKQRRMKGTISTIKKWNTINQGLVELFRTYVPATISTEHLRYYINQIPYSNSKTGKRYNPLSLQRRLMRRKIIRFDAGLGKWINLTLLQEPEQ